MKNRIELERNEMSEILAQNFALNDEKFDASDFEWSAHCLQMADYRKPEWISVEERLPTKEENEIGLVGIVNGDNGNIGFHDAIILVDYDFDEKEWWSQDFDIEGCKVEYWMPLPMPPRKEDEGK